MNTQMWQKTIDKWMEEKNVPAVAVSVRNKDDVIFEKGFGITSVEDPGTPITPNTIFGIGSATKTFTGFLVMKLVEEGLLDLDTPIIEYIPWLKVHREGVEKEITLRVLMSHTSGLPHRYSPVGYKDPADLETQLKEELPKLFMISEPEDNVYYYSNFGTRLAAHVAEAVTGKLYQELLIEYICKPLDMPRTTVENCVAMSYPIAQGHYFEKDGVKVVHRFDDNAVRQSVGSIMSTASDLSKFASVIMNKGKFNGKQYMREETITQMMEANANLWDINGTSYGLFMRVEPYKNIVKVGHTGFQPPYVTRMWTVPEEGITVIVLISMKEEELANDIVKLVLDDMLDLEEVNKIEQGESNPEIEKAACGKYFGYVPGIVELDYRDGKLVVISYDREYVMTPMKKPGLYYCKDEKSGKDISLGIPAAVGGTKKYVVFNSEPCEYLENQELKDISVEEKKEYVGKYQLQSQCVEFFLEGDELKMTYMNMPQSHPCIYIRKNLIATRIAVGEFVRDEKDNVTAVDMANRIMMTKQ